MRQAGWWLGVTCVIGLAGCAGSPPASNAAGEAPAAEVATPVERLLQVRAAAHDNDDALDVQPIDHAEVADLRQQAEALESSGDFEAAERLYAQALEIAPDAPLLLQLRAEMQLAMGELDSAELIAARAYQAGPKLGPLCRRSWATVRLARELRGNPEAAQVAAEQAQRCATPPPVRM